jgi:transposase
VPEILNDTGYEFLVSMRQGLDQMWTMDGRLEEEFEVFDQRLKELTSQDDECQRLMKLEGVGPVSAIRLKLQLSNSGHFKNG